MHTGMLWSENNPKIDLKTRLDKATVYYRAKYHRKPNLCLVHPGMLADGQAQFEEVTVRVYRAVLPGHLWIGIEEN